MSAATVSAVEATATFTAAEAVELAVIERCGFIESRHIGSAAVVDPAGQLVFALGDVDTPVLGRSCLKPFQAIAAMRLGAPLAGEAAVLATASHRAEQAHVEVVEKMLASVNVEPAALQCPSVMPADRTHRVNLRGSELTRSPLYFNCSGKHAAFLMAAKLNGWDLESYLDPAHPVQRTVAEVVEEFTGTAPAAVAVDGCGAPVFALGLRHLAAGISRVAQGRGPEPQGPAEAEPRLEEELQRQGAEARRLMDAVFAHPWAIEGHGRPNTTVIERLGVFAKFGAEGVMVMSSRDGHAVAVKCLDGSSRATTLTALHLLIAAGAVSAEGALEVMTELDHEVTGGTAADGSTAIVGSIRAGEALLGIRADESRDPAREPAGSQNGDPQPAAPQLAAPRPAAPEPDAPSEEEAR